MNISQKQKKNLIIKVAFLLIFFCVSLLFIYINQLKDSNLIKVYSFDVGEGSANLIRGQNGQNILIDGGPDNSILSELGSVLPFYEKHISLVILTHPHMDHLYGLIKVLENYKVDEFLMTDVNYESEYYKILKEMLIEKNIKTTIVQNSMQYNLDSDTYLKILYPFQSMQGKNIENVNNSSIVSQLVDGSIEYLFTGDIEQEIEDEIVRKNINITSDILIAPHHGSKTSSTMEFIKLVSPKVVIMSLGKNNKFGHPHKSTLDNYKSLNINVLRTDYLKTIKINSDGKNFY